MGDAGELLLLQSMIVAEDADPVAGLQELLGKRPEYATAWLTLAAAAERSGMEALAIEAADRGAELWPQKRWSEKAENLRNRLIDSRIELARTLLESGDVDGTIEHIAPVLEIEPTNRDAVLIKAQALLAAGDIDAAEIVLIPLERDPGALLLAGEIAERRSDWLTAMDLYTALPDDEPEKASLLHRAQMRWRMSILPPYVHEAMAAPVVDRADLAVILVSLAPQVETIDGGPVPVMSDIVGLDGQREIVTAVRIDLMASDPIEHRFHPDRPATISETRSAIEALGNALTTEAPIWCDDDESPPACEALADPIDGPSLTELTLRMLERETQ